MSKIRLVLACISVVGCCISTVWAFPGDQAAASMDALVSAIRANRKALVAVNLELTDREAAGFWTVYDRYQQEINAIGDRLVDVIRDYSESFDTLTDDKAMKLIEAYLAVEVDRVAVRRNYLDAFSRTLPGRKLARLYQIENKMDAVLRYELAAAIPVVEEKSGAAQ